MMTTRFLSSSTSHEDFIFNYNLHSELHMEQYAAHNTRAGHHGTICST